MFKTLYLVVRFVILKSSLNTVELREKNRFKSTLMRIVFPMVLLKVLMNKKGETKTFSIHYKSGETFGQYKRLTHSTYWILILKHAMKTRTLACAYFSVHCIWRYALRLGCCHGNAFWSWQFINFCLIFVYSMLLLLL